MTTTISRPPMRLPSYKVDQLRNDLPVGLFSHDRYPIMTGPRRSWYRLDICRDGALTIARADQKSFNGVAIAAMRVPESELDKLIAVQHRVGKVQSKPEPKTIRRIDKGVRRIFSWGIRTGTLSQVERMADVMWLLMEDREDEAIELAVQYDQAAAREDSQSYGAVYSR